MTVAPGPQFTTGTLLDGRAVMEDWLARGEAEVPDGSNCNDISHEYGFCAAWCCMTWSVMLKHIGLPVYWGAGVADAMAKAQQGYNGLRWLSRDAATQEGDAWLFDWKGNRNPSDMHIAAWVRDPGSQSKVLTIAGNENNRVTEQWRDRTYLMGIIRPPFHAASAPPAPTQEDNMAIYRVVYKGGANDPSRAGQFAIIDGCVLPIPDQSDLADIVADKPIDLAVDQPLYDAIARRSAKDNS